MPHPFDSLCLNVSMSAPSINSSVSMLFRVLHILSILTGPNIFFSICLSKMRSRHFYRVFLFLLDGSCRPRRCSEFLLHILKVFVNCDILSSSRHQLLHLPETRRTTQAGRTSGGASGRRLSVKDGVKTPCMYKFHYCIC